MLFRNLPPDVTPKPQANRHTIPLHLRGRFRAEWGNFFLGDRGDDLELLLEHLRRCKLRDAAAILDAVLEMWPSTEIEHLPRFPNRWRDVTASCPTAGLCRAPSRSLDPAVTPEGEAEAGQSHASQRLRFAGRRAD